MLFGQQPQQETKSCRIGHEPKIYQKFTEESWLATNDASIMCSNGGVGCGVGGGGIGGDIGGGVGSDDDSVSDDIVARGANGICMQYLSLEGLSSLLGGSDGGRGSRSGGGGGSGIGINDV